MSYHKPLTKQNKGEISSNNNNQHDNKATRITISQSITSSYLKKKDLGQSRNLYQLLMIYHDRTTITTTN